MKHGTWNERCIVSLISYMISGVFLSDLFLDNLQVESVVWEVLLTLCSLFS